MEWMIIGVFVYTGIGIIAMFAAIFLEEQKRQKKDNDG